MNNIPKLTIEQAVKIRDDFRHLEGEEVSSGGLRKVINRIVVAPYYSDKFNTFFGKYYMDHFQSRKDEELLAISLRPDSYCVYVFYHDINGVVIYDNLFETLPTMKKSIDLNKYKVTS